MITIDYLGKEGSERPKIDYIIYEQPLKEDYHFVMMYFFSFSLWYHSSIR